jgi:hypothetical protein
VVSLELDRGLQFVLGTVETRGARPPEQASAASETRPSRLPDRLAHRALRWWGTTYDRWLDEERVRARRVNRFVLWNSRRASAVLFLFPVEAALGGPILLVGEQGHHPVLARLAHRVGSLTAQPRRGNLCGGTLLVCDCPVQAREGVRRELRRISRRQVLFR